MNDLHAPLDKILHDVALLRFGEEVMSYATPDMITRARKAAVLTLEIFDRDPEINHRQTLDDLFCICLAGEIGEV